MSYVDAGPIAFHVQRLLWESFIESLRPSAVTRIMSQSEVRCGFAVRVFWISVSELVGFVCTVARHQPIKLFHQKICQTKSLIDFHTFI